MGNPLKSVLEKKTLFAFTNVVIDGEVKQIKSKCRYLLSLKRVKTVEDVNLRTDELIKQTYKCWVLSKITLAQLENIVGFGNERMEYLIISREQSILTPINKVFGVRCECERLT